TGRWKTCVTRFARKGAAPVAQPQAPPAMAFLRASNRDLTYNFIPDASSAPAGLDGCADHDDGVRPRPAVASIPSARADGLSALEAGQPSRLQQAFDSERHAVVVVAERDRGCERLDEIARL